MWSFGLFSFRFRHPVYWSLVRCGMNGALNKPVRRKRTVSKLISPDPLAVQPKGKKVRRPVEETSMVQSSPQPIDPPIPKPPEYASIWDDPRIVAKTIPLDDKGHVISILRRPLRLRKYIRIRP